MAHNKRKRVVISIEEKLKAIERLDAGETIKSVANDYGVSAVTVGDWKRNRTKIEQWCTKQASTSSGRKSMKRSEHERVGEALFMWFTEQRSKGVPLSARILQQTALLFSEQFPGTDHFSASAGWLDRWKKRYGIRQLNNCGDVSAVDNFKKDFKKLIEENGYTRDQIYNCDESGLNYKMLPAKTSAPGYKRSKERITIMACANASGRHKIPLMVIGKSAQPRALKDISPKALPVYYKNQKSACMVEHLFTTWFNDEFVPSVTRFLKRNGLPAKAVLLMDTAPSHPAEELRNNDIIVKVLPANVTRILQPMDQGVLDTVKINYRRQLLQNLLDLSETEDLASCLQKITLKDVVYWISQAWDSVQASTIQKSWSKLTSFNNDYDEDDLLLLNELRAKLINNKEASSVNVDTDKGEDAPSLTGLMRQLKGCEQVTDDDVRQWLTSDDVEHESSIEEIVNATKRMEEMEDDPDDCIVIAEHRISHQEGFAAFEKVLLYVEQQAEAKPADVLLIKRWRDIAARKRRTK